MSNAVVAIVTSIHKDFDSRIWKHALSVHNHERKVYLLCPWEVDSGSKKNGVQFLTFKRVVKRWKRPFIIPIRIFKRLYSIRKEIDIIHFHDIDILPWMAVVSFFIPVIYDVHENYPDEMLVRSWIPKIARRPLYYVVKLSQYIFSIKIKNIVLVTEMQEESYFSKCYFNKLMIKNYASVDMLTKCKDDYMERENTLLFIGAHYHSNGSFLLLEILEEVIKIRDDIRLIVVDRFSDTRYREDWVIDIKKRKLDEYIELVEPVKAHEVINYLNISTIALNPVLRIEKQIKAINQKLFEFMAGGLPVVTSDLPYPKMLIEKESCGLLAQPENPKSFSDAICKLIGDRDLAYNMGMCGKKAFIDSYSWESQMPSLMDYYSDII